MFNDNKYSHWYYQIINRAQSRRLPNDCYIETHHIIPKCLGGNDNKDNLVELTAREHFIVHWLLSKMFVETQQKYQMWNAFSCMLYRERPGQHRYKVSSRIFESIKTAGSKIKSEQFSGKNNPMYGKRGELSPYYGKKKSADHLAKLSKSHKGVVRTLESRAKQSASMSGRTQTQEHIEKRKCVGSKNGRFGYKMSAEEIAQRTATLKKNKLAKKLAQEN
jgi:excinuclease UvrABC ATPase subunit